MQIKRMLEKQIFTVKIHWKVYNNISIQYMLDKDIRVYEDIYPLKNVFFEYDDDWTFITHKKCLHNLKPLTLNSLHSENGF